MYGANYKPCGEWLRFEPCPIHREIQFWYRHGLKMAEKYPHTSALPGGVDGVMCEFLPNRDPQKRGPMPGLWMIRVGLRHYDGYSDYIVVGGRAAYDLTPKQAYKRLWHNWRDQKRIEWRERIEALQDEILELADCE